MNSKEYQMSRLCSAKGVEFAGSLYEPHKELIQRRVMVVDQGVGFIKVRLALHEHSPVYTLSRLGDGRATGNAWKAQRGK